MAARLVVLDPCPETLGLFRRVGAASGLEVIAEPSSEGCDPDAADLAAVAPAAFPSPEARRAFIEGRHPDTVLLLVGDDSDLESLSERERAVLAGLAQKPLGPALASAHLEGMRRRRHAAESKRALASRIIGAQEAERHHLARELHDAVGQMLLVHKLDAEWLSTRATSVELQRAGGALARGLEKTLELVRLLARGLRPPALDDLGLGPALETLALDITRRSPCRVIPHLDLDRSEPDAEAATTLYRIAQEALANAVKHARCTRIWLALGRDREGAIELRIEDDGVGLSDAAATSRGSLGLIGMRERAALHDGEVSIASRAQGGTNITARIPSPAAEAGR